jgi:uncharacterized protein (DUF58 family)
MTLGQRIVIVLFFLSFGAGLVTGAQLYYRLSYLWAFLLVGGWLWSRWVLSGLKFQRRARTLRAQVGQVFEERFELGNPSRLPRFLISLRDDSPLPGSQGSRVFPLIEPRRGRSYVARTRLLQRGVFPLGPTVLESGDPFGLFPVTVTTGANDAVLVYPMMVDIPTFPQPAGIMPGGDAVRRRTPHVTTNAAGVREYAPGDPLNRIHWVSTARRGRLIAKEFELDPQAEVWVFFDAMSAVQASLPVEAPPLNTEDFWDRATKTALPPSTEEYGVSVAASLARYYLRQGRAVGLASAGQLLSVVPPERGGRQLSKILEALALLRADGSLPLRGLVEMQAQHIVRGSTVVLITASVQQEVALVADYMLRRGLRPIVVLIDAGSFDGPGGTDQLETMIKLLNIPVRRVQRGANLSVALAGMAH